MNDSNRQEQEDGYSKSDPSDLLQKQMKYDEQQVNNQIIFNDLLGQKSPMRPEPNPSSASNNSSDIKSRVGFSSQTSEYRKAFYHFQRLIQNSEQNAQQYNTRFQKNLNIKTQDILDSKGMADFFERQLFKLARNPKQLRKNWSEDETLLLLSLMAYFCCLYNEDFMNLSEKAWTYIATMYPGKSPDQLKLRWQNVLKVPLNKSPWTKNEDDMLEELVKDKGAAHWREIAMELHSRSGTNQFRQSKQCRERWTNHLDPSLKKGSWSNREDVILLKEFLSKGKKWSDIAKRLPGRTENSVKNRWVSLLKKYKSNMALEELKQAEEFSDEEAWNLVIAKTLIELKERDLSGTSSEGDYSLFSEDKAQYTADIVPFGGDKLKFSASGDSDKALGCNLNQKDFGKQNKFVSDKIQDEFNKGQVGITDSFLSQNTNYVAQDSFKELIEWQKDHDNQQQQQQNNSQLLPQQSQQLFQQNSQQQQQFQQSPQQTQYYSPEQSMPLFSNTSQNSAQSQEQQVQSPQFVGQMQGQQQQNQGSQNFNPYSMNASPQQYNNTQPQPFQQNIYPNNYGMPWNSQPYYQSGPSMNQNWGMPNYNPNPNYNMNQFQMQPQMQQQMQPQQFQYPYQQQQPQFQPLMQQQTQFQPQFQTQTQPQNYQNNQAGFSDPNSNLQFKEKPVSSLLDQNTGNNAPNSGYYLTMVDVNKNEIYFMNKVNQNDLSKTIGMNTQPQQQYDGGNQGSLRMYSEEEAYDMQNPMQGEGENDKVNALNLKWTLGMNYTIKNGVHNLSNENRKELFYAAAHTGVLYDFENGTQRLLQGHCNKITCTNYCEKEDILITADEDEHSMLVVWDAKTATPRKTIFDPHPNGVEAMDITPDGRYIITVSKEKNPEKDLQNFTLWDWKNDGPANIITCEIHPEVEDYQYHVLFNSNDNKKEFVSTGKKRVLFWSWESHEKGFELYSPAFSQPKTFTQTVFIPGSSQAVTGTSDGYIVVWDVSLILEDFSQPEERRAIKVVNLLDPTQNKSESSKGKKAPEITTLLIQGNHLVIGASNGTVRFYDLQFRIIAWFEDIGIGKITSISFAKDNPYQYTQEEEKKKDKDVLTCPDFIVVDTNCVVTLLRAELFSMIDDEKKKGVVLMKLLNSPITAIAVRPNSYTVAIVCENGRLYEWNYYDRSPILEPKKIFESNNLPTCIEYSPDGRFLCVGTVKGALFFNDYSLDKNGNEVGWTNEEDHQVSKDKARKGANEKIVPPKILQLAFSPDSQHLAVMDDHCCCTLFKIDYQYRNMNKAKEWIFSGKLKIHKQPLRGIAFGESQRILDKQDQPETYLRLFSVSEDKKLVEYDVAKSNNNKLYEKDIITIEQETNPCAVIWYPVNKFKEDILMVVNEDFKIKLWNVSDDHKYTKKTCLGPAYGDPINRLLVINTPKDNEKYLAYSTPKKVVGLIKLPADGNPHNNMGLIAHPGEITGIAVSSDGNYLFTSGGGDFSVNMWHIDIGTMEQTMFNTGDPMAPFIDLLEGGQEGQLLRDLKDFFYYSQIRSKDENTTKFRKLEGMVPLNELANLMRALGYYPTNKEIENMMKETEFSQFPDEPTTVKEADLDTCIKLFVNHRPMYGIGKKQIQEAVNTIAGEDDKGEEGKVSWERLYQLLQTRGEPMSEEEIKEAFERLMGEDADNEIPEVIDSEFLAKDILGFEEADTDEVIMDQI